MPRCHPIRTCRTRRPAALLRIAPALALVALAGCNSETMQQDPPEDPPVEITLSGTASDVRTDGTNLSSATARMVTSSAFGTSSMDNGTASFSVSAEDDGTVRAASAIERTDLEPRADGTLPGTGTATLDGTYALISARNIRADGDDVTFTASYQTGNISLTANFARQTLKGTGRHIEIDGSFAPERTAGTSFRTYPLTGTVTHNGIEGELDGRILQSAPTLVGDDAATIAEFDGRDYKRPPEPKSGASTNSATPATRLL